MKICPVCGSAAKDADTFCANCGLALPVQAAPAQPEAGQPEAAAPVAASEQAPPSAAGAYAAPAYNQGAYVPPYAPQQPYYPYPSNGYGVPALEEPMTLGDWMISLLVCSIPVVNLVLLCVWAFGQGQKISKRNWARAMLVWMAIGLGLSILLFLFIGIFSASLYY